jgi:acyl phosphate:glycerol-3-phosphate acyltransferase
VPLWSYILTALAAYLIGSIPTGFLIARAKGIDIRAVGSGNIGATNAMRALGKPVGIAVLLLDVAKGSAACVLGGFIFTWISDLDFFDDGFYVVLRRFMVVAGIFAVLGHNYTCWLKFKGGKGIATTAGVYLALAPAALGIALVAFIVAVLVTRYVSVGSITAAVAVTAAVWILPPHDPMLGIVTTALGALAIYRHKANIRRLIAGTENRLQFKKKEKT